MWDGIPLGQILKGLFLKLEIQAGQSEFNLWGPHGGKRDLTHLLISELFK